MLTKEQNLEQKYSRKKNNNNKGSTAIQSYECYDFEIPVLEQDKYFEGLQEKGIKTQKTTKKNRSQSKNQILLQKLQYDLNQKHLIQLQKQMDLQVSKILDEQME